MDFIMGVPLWSILPTIVKASAALIAFWAYKNRKIIGIVIKTFPRDVT